MERKSTSKETQGLSADDLCDHRLKMACGDFDVSRPGTARVGDCGGWEYFLDPAYAGRVGDAAPLPLLETILSARSPGAIKPGIFFDISHDLNLQCASWDEIPEETPSAEDTDAEQFHDSELGDVYDLYNACNGVMLNDLLDVGKLGELSDEEREVLDVERLKKVWEHTATRCGTCAQIVRTLNDARRALRSGWRDSPTGEPEQ
jgi:hypothetical protein